MFWLLMRVKTQTFNVGCCHTKFLCICASSVKVLGVDFINLYEPWYERAILGMVEKWVVKTGYKQWGRGNEDHCYNTFIGK